MFYSNRIAEKILDPKVSLASHPHHSGGRLVGVVLEFEPEDSFHEQMDTLAAILKDYKKLKAWAREVSKSVLHISGGGSEMFLQIGDDYYIDPKTACLRIEEKMETLRRLYYAQTARAASAKEG